MNLKNKQHRAAIRILGVLALASLAGPTLRAKADPAPIRVDVDATDVSRHLLRSTLTIPVQPGQVALWFPKWIPGIHGPGQQIGNVAGLSITAGSNGPIAWSRDPEDLYRFLVDVPAGVETLTVELTYIANQPSNLSNGVDSFGNQDLLILNFNTCLLYPENGTARETMVALRVRLPESWKYGTALSLQGAEDGWHTFAPASLETVIDSPLIAGRNYRRVDFESADFPRTRLHVVSESAEALEFSDELCEKYRQLMTEALLLFGDAPFTEYDFLIYCSDLVPPTGIEHQASSLNGIEEQALVDDKLGKDWAAYLLPHELVHAWCGKYRRPEGMYRDNYHANKRTELLWIYEGLTQYLGHVLTIRSGLLSFDEHLERTAGRVGYLSLRTGRQWRSLADTAIANYTLRATSQSWNDLRRGQDYYDEGALFWLEVDCLIREETGGEKSLDDFCRAFFAVDEPNPPISSYQLDEVIAELDKLVPLDWEGLIRRRIYRPLDDLGLDSLWHAGYEYYLTDERPDYVKLREENRKYISAEHSLGVTLDEEGVVLSVAPGSAADQAGLAPTMKLVGVNSRKFTAKRFRTAISRTKETGRIDLLMLDNERYRSFDVEYAGGERYPALRRIDERGDLLREICTPRSAS